jgi:beta-fructofuranosidase
LKSTDLVELDIYLDQSSVEVFVNGGEETFTARVFPSREGRFFGVFSKGGSVEIVKAEKSDMREAVEF